MSEINWLEVILIFLATAVSDVLWVFYIRRTNKGKAISAAAFSSFIVLLGGLVVLAYVDNIWYLIPAALGAFAGTIISIKLDIKFDIRNKKRK
jgi:branched-subunit amino acid ABC-type transport system permease component